MGNESHFDTLIVVTADDCKRLLPLYPRLINNYKYGKLCFIGPTAVGEVIGTAGVIADNSYIINENELISFDEVHKCMAHKLKDILKGREMPRPVTGWYYQQFLKMQYSVVCKDEYYMVWDGDTIPCREIKMFQAETGKPYLDMKHEYHPEYFDTISKILPGFRKVIERSFISEHMLFKTEIMRCLINDIEKNEAIPGTKFWEKIINSIPAENISHSSFSEFETYGTYVAMRFPDIYKLRDWHSFRLGSQFFSIDTITERDFSWLGKDFDAISFEKNQTMMGDGNTFFNDPSYQEKLSAKQMLQAIQMEFNGGYKEVWADDPVTMKHANVTKGGFVNGKGVDNRTLFVIVDNGDSEMLSMSIEGIKESLSELNYKIVTTDKNLPFYQAVNSAIRKMDGTQYQDWDIFVIKSGTKVIFDSIHFLKQAMYSCDEVGAAGSVSNLAGNKQKLNVSFATPEEYISFGEKNNVLMEDPYLERVTLSSNALLIKRAAYEKVGGFAEEFGEDGIVGDADFSLRLLACGYRLRLVRNSFVYRAVWDEIEDKISDDNVGLLSLIYANPDMIANIPFDKVSRFNALEIGCGLGANMKAIRSLYPEAILAGIEKNEELASIASKTELVYTSLEELKSNIEGPAFNLLIASKEGFKSLSQQEKEIIGSLCTSDFQVVTK